MSDSTLQLSTPPLSADDLRALADAIRKLESQSFAMTLATRVGMPVEALLKLLPRGAQGHVSGAVNKALEGCLHAALAMGGRGGGTAVSKRAHTAATAVTGAVGGFFGLPGLLVELPVTTTVMLHSIAGIAKAQGEDLADPASALACLQVFALGPEGTPREALDSAYYTTRAALAQVTREAAAYVAQKGVAKEGAPMLLSFLSKIAARFGLEVTEKAAAQLVPIVGAAGGLTLNILFTDHFQRLAEGHFTVRRLERIYGGSAVHGAYMQLRGLGTGS